MTTHLIRTIALLTALPALAVAGTLADSTYILPAQAVKDYTESHANVRNLTEENARLSERIADADKLPAGRGFIEKFNAYNKLLANYTIMEQDHTVVVDRLGEIIDAMRGHAADTESANFVNAMIANTLEEIRDDEAREEELMSGLEAAGAGVTKESVDAAAQEIEFFSTRKEAMAQYKAMAVQIEAGRRQQGAEVAKLTMIRSLWRMKLGIISSQKRLIASRKQTAGICASQGILFGRTSCGGRGLKPADILPPDTGIKRLLGHSETSNYDGAAGRAAILERLKQRRANRR